MGSILSVFEIVIAVFLGAWVAVAAIISYAAYKQDCKKAMDKENEK